MEGELVISEGLQRVRLGDAVMAGPASPPPAIAGAGGQAGTDAAKPPSEVTKPAPGQPRAKR
jgi:hypothetical protein